MTDGSRALIARTLFIASMVAFVLCLVMPAYFTGRNHYGIKLLLLGPIGLLSGYYTWLANAPLLLSWLAYGVGQRVLALCLATTAFALALTLFQHQTVPVMDSFFNGSRDLPFQVKIGYYTWLFSMVAIGSASLINSKKSLSAIDTPSD